MDMDVGDVPLTGSDRDRRDHRPKRGKRDKKRDRWSNHWLCLICYMRTMNDRNCCHKCKEPRGTAPTQAHMFLIHRSDKALKKARKTAKLLQKQVSS